MIRRTAPIVVAAALLIPACSTDDGGSPPTSGGTNPPVTAVPGIRTIAALEPFDACDDLLDHVRSAASARVTPYGLDAYGGVSVEGGVRFEAVGDAISADEMEGAPVPSTAPTAEERSDGGDATTEGGGSYSTTNVQEAGVDEPDVVKTDGEVIITSVDGQLRVFTLADDVPTPAGELALDGGYGHELLLDGDHVLVLATGSGGEIPVDIADSDDGASADEAVVPWSEETVLTTIDISDPTRPTVTGTRVIEGGYLSARMVEGRAHVVTTTSFVGPPMVSATSEAAERTALLTNHQAIADSELDDWLPDQAVITPDGDVEVEPLVACEDVARPTAYAGDGTVSIVSLDLDEPLDGADATSVLASAEHVYASADHLYLATAHWPEPVSWEEQQQGEAPMWEPADTDTSIHRFTLSDDGPATHTSSGSVPGTLLSQWAMSEHDGVLRVASTVGEAWMEGPEESESRVTTLAEEDGALVELGSVGGLGRGETIYAVRMMGDTGYVVTFRQTDPLYTIDLSDPAAPRMVGELKIPGYSAYLHPVGDGLLLGVGQDATDEGARLGAQVSLFDVSDPAAPTRTATFDLGDGSTDVEFDHRAFLWWDPTDLAVLPVQSYGYDAQSAGFFGAMGLRVTAEGISEVGRVAHPTDTSVIYEPVLVPDCPPDADCVEPPAVCPPGAGCGMPAPVGEPIIRSLVVGDSLITVGATGLLTSDLGSLAAGTWVPFE